MKPKKTFQEYSRNEEIVNIITHGVGIPLSLVAVYYLFSSGSTMYLAFGIYTFSMLATYLSSTLYHLASNANLKLKNLLHLLDHAAIYLFIAGTYTPISFLVLSGSTLWWILGSVWAFAWWVLSLKYSLSASTVFLAH
jgi:hemolysin III